MFVSKSLSFMFSQSTFLHVVNNSKKENDKTDLRWNLRVKQFCETRLSIVFVQSDLNPLHSSLFEQKSPRSCFSVLFRFCVFFQNSLLFQIPVWVFFSVFHKNSILTKGNFSSIALKLGRTWYLQKDNYSPQKSWRRNMVCLVFFLESTKISKQRKWETISQT